MTTATDWVDVSASCGNCSKTDSVSVPADRYREWKAGANIVWVFRNLSPQQRDILIGADTSRPFPYYLCRLCWDLTFEEGEEE
jgi:hypothetical protein